MTQDPNRGARNAELCHPRALPKQQQPQRILKVVPERHENKPSSQPTANPEPYTLKVAAELSGEALCGCGAGAGAW